jgi:dTDP-4-dehydrorhamnose reductase
MCKELGIHLTILGSAQVYDGEKYFTEDDKPNFDLLFYSRMRILLEDVIRNVYENDVLYLRIVYPITLDGNEKCFLEKIKTRKHNIHNTSVSLTIVPSLFPKIKQLIDKNTVGILNFTNEGSITLENLLKMFNEKCVISKEKSNRGECKMDVTRLKKIIDVESIEDALKINHY